MVMDISKNLLEISIISLLIVGLIVSLAVRGNPTLNYIIIFLCGGIFGRLLYQRGKNPKIGYVLVIIGFVIGYLIGSYYADANIILLLFILGGVLSYWVHFKKWVKI